MRREVLPHFARETPARASVSPVNAFGGGSRADSAAIQYVLRGPDLDKLATYAQAMLGQVRAIPGVVDPDTTLVVGKPELTVRINRARAADLGVSALDIATTLRSLVAGIQVSTYNEGGEQYEVWVRAARPSAPTPAPSSR